MSHFSQLLRYVPDLTSRKILDIGSGEGAFAIEAARNGCRVDAIEYYEGHIRLAELAARDARVEIKFRLGRGEDLPYSSQYFDFVNISEVLEHVEEPLRVLSETARVLKSGGLVYLSVPNRFGLRDPHLRLYFINWMPRSWSSVLLRLMHYKKIYEFEKGRQLLSEMHYSTFGNIRIMAESVGFDVSDMRIVRISKDYPRVKYMLLPIYYLARTVYFDTFHLLLRKL